jgi:phosphatidylserine sn-1 acylhydrolase
LGTLWGELQEHLRILNLFCLFRAHVCGLMSNHLNFRLERIIALDPARPLIRPGNQNRLDSGDARSVQVIHTNAGYYGEAGRVGHIDFCVNGGRR